jgi:hypothetical protein
MKLIIAGGRSCTDFQGVLEAFNIFSGLYGYPEEIISGGASGVDKIGEKIADQLNIKLIQFPALWELFGKAAGPKRNEEMADYADALLLYWDGKSRGSKNMKKCAKKHNLLIVEHLIKET